MAGALVSLVNGEVTRAETDFQNVRARALSIVGVSGGLVALVSGLLAIASTNHAHAISGSARLSLLGALIAFVLATISALIINRPVDITGADPDDLKKVLQEKLDEDKQELETADLLVDYLSDLRSSNQTTAKWLSRAIFFEIIGIALTALMAVLIVQHP